MKKAVLYLVTLLFVSTGMGCASATKRVNSRAEKHIKYHASNRLECDESKLKTTCVKEYKSGECYQYEVIGCNSGIVFKNVTGSGWQAGSSS